MCVLHFWVKFSRAEDLSDTWLAHCLDLDVVTWGSSIPEALYMGREAITITVMDDIADGHDWRSRRAPKEMWDELLSAMKTSTPRTLQSIADDPQFEGVFYANIAVEIPEHINPDESTERPKVDGDALGVAMVA